MRLDLPPNALQSYLNSICQRYAQARDATAHQKADAAVCTIVSFYSRRCFAAAVGQPFAEIWANAADAVDVVFGV